MKKLLPLFFLMLAAGTFAQDSATATPTPPLSLKNVTVERACRTTITKAYDEVEDETYFYGREITLTKNRRRGLLLNPTLLEDGKYIALRFAIAGMPGCVRDHGRVSILFRDGTRLITNFDNSFMECNGRVEMYFGDIFGGLDDLKVLMEKPIKTIRVYTFDSSIEEDFSLAQANSLIASLKCLHPMLLPY